MTAELEQAFSSEAEAGAAGDQAVVPSETLLHFWIEQGLSQSAAAKLLDEIRLTGRTYTTNQLRCKSQSTSLTASGDHNLSLFPVAIAPRFSGGSECCRMPT